MKHYHKADYQLAKWIDDACEPGFTRVATKKISEEDTPYGSMERASQLQSSVIENALKVAEEDMEKRIEEATTPEELEAIEKELETNVDKAKGQDPESDEPKSEDAPESDETTNEAPADKTDDSSSDDTTSTDVGKLQEEIKQLKEEVDELSGEEKMQHEINLLKRRLDNIVVQDDPDMNDSIFQEASADVAHCKRCMRRIMSSRIATLTSEQQQEITEHLELDNGMSYQELAKFLAPRLNAPEIDIYYFLKTRDTSLPLDNSIEKEN